MYRNHAVIHGIVIGEVYGLKPVFEDTKELNFHIEQMDINKDKLAYVKNVLKAKDFWMEELAHSAGVDIVTTNENKDTEGVLYYPKYYAANRENPFGNPIEQDDIVTFKDIYLEALQVKGLLQYVPSKMSFTMAQQRDYQWLWDRYNNEHFNEFSGNAVSYAIDDLLSSDYIPACKTVEKLKEVVKVFCDEWRKE